jgi:hypothetical protein
VPGTGRPWLSSSVARIEIGLAAAPWGGLMTNTQNRGPGEVSGPDEQAPADLQVLAAWAPELADTFVALSCDLALVIDEQGRILKLAQHDANPIAPPSWIGRAWIDTVSSESREKVEAMLADVAASGHSRRRQVNHPDALGGSAAPVAYTAARLGEHGPMLAIGHDQRAIAALQQRFVAAQEALERSYWNAHQHLRGAAPAPALMTRGERASLGLGKRGAGTSDLDDSELARALGHLVERIGQGELPVLLRDARRLAERHFLARALQRAGSEEALAKSLGVSKRSLSRRKKKS